MTAVFKCALLRHTATWLVVVLMIVSAVPAQAVGAPQPAAEANHSSPNAIPFDQLGAQADQQFNGSDLGIEARAGGAQLRAVVQDLAGRLGAQGLWLRSTAEETAEAPFRVLATAIGRDKGVPQPLAGAGVVAVEPEIARFIRPGLVEEYSVSTDGVRQDFVLLERPAGAGALRLELAIDGAQATASGEGISLVLDGSGRRLAYSRLHVSDADGRTLAAHLEATAADRIAAAAAPTPPPTTPRPRATPEARSRNSNHKIFQISVPTTFREAASVFDMPSGQLPGR